MAFHKSVLGRYGENLFSDEWGYVPQIGDHPRQFCWKQGTRFSRREWNKIIYESEKKTRIALRKKKGIPYRKRKKK